jgi:hypothetical protein
MPLAQFGVSAAVVIRVHDQPRDRIPDRVIANIRPIALFEFF